MNINAAGANDSVCGWKSGNPDGPERIFPGTVAAEAPSCYYRRIITGGGRGQERWVMAASACWAGVPPGLDCRPKPDVPAPHVGLRHSGVRAQLLPWAKCIYYCWNTSASVSLTYLCGFDSFLPPLRAGGTFCPCLFTSLTVPMIFFIVCFPLPSVYRHEISLLHHPQLSH